MSMEGPKQDSVSESFQTLIRYLNPQTPKETMVPEGTTFELAPLTEVEAQILEKVLRVSKRESVKLSSKDNLSVDHILKLLNAIGKNSSFKTINIDLKPNYAVQDMATLRAFLELPIERQRPADTSARDEAELSATFSGLLISARNDLGEIATAATESWTAALERSKTLLNNYVAPAFNSLFDEAAVSVLPLAGSVTPDGAAERPNL